MWTAPAMLRQEAGGRVGRAGGGAQGNAESRGDFPRRGPRLGRWEGRWGSNPLTLGVILSMRGLWSFHREGSAGQTQTRDRGSEKRWARCPHAHRRSYPTGTGAM